MAEGQQGTELSKLGQALDEASFRRAFALDPQSAMQAEGIDPSEISANVIDALAELTPAELRVLAHVKDALDQADVDPGIKAYMV